MDVIKQVLKKIFGSKEGKNASWIVVGRISQMVLSLIVSVFTARYLGPSNYGLINYAASYAAFLMSLCTLGINSVIIKIFNDLPDEEGNTIGTALILRLISSILSIFLIAFIVNVIDKGEPITINVCIIYSFTLIFQIFETFNYWFQSKYNSKVSSLATLFGYILISIYKIVILILNKNVYWFAFSSALDNVFIAIFLYISYKKNGGPKLTFSLNKAKLLLGTSYHYILSGMMVAIYSQTDKLMLKKMMNETMVGYYSLAYNLNTMWVFVLSAIIASLSPTIISLYKTDKKAYLKKNRQLYSIVIYVCLFVAIGMIALGKPVINIMYGNEYLPAYKPLCIICWYTMFSYLGVARESWIICENKQKYLKYMYFLAAILNILLNLVFIPNFGASGAAFASFITQVFTCILLPLIIKDLRPNVILMFESLNIFKK